MKKIGIIIPTYHEEENIGSLVDTIKFYIPNSEIFVVDDTPSNGSEETLKDKKFVHYFHSCNFWITACIKKRLYRAICRNGC